MAESLAIIGLVANIFQFIEQGCKILSASKEVYSSAQGTTKSIEDLRLLGEDIRNRCDRVSKLSPAILSDDEGAVRKYASECGDLASELLALLDKLTANQGVKFRKVESLRIALHSVMKKNDLEVLKDRLVDLDKRMRYRLLNIFDAKRYSSIVSLIQDLDQKNQRMELTSSSRFEELRRTISTTLADSQTRVDKVVMLLIDLQNQAESTAKHQQILTGLMFSELKQRYSDIDRAQSKTFEWAYDPQLTNFTHWLESGSGIFWICGLAGSGKSTFMKYLCKNHMTADALRNWAGPATLVTASFFFWHQGTRMEKSRHGLLQSLVFQILRTNLDLCLKLCPKHNGAEPWTVDELMAVITKISKLDLGTNKFCFFIDGLDEYDGEEFDIINTVKALAACQDIKICTSSRPWNAFKRAFENSCAFFILENHTMNDIKFYIRQELENSRPFIESAKKDPRCHEIITKLATRAQGVFLWVFLVVRGLKRDLQSQESYEHLQRRVDEIPPKLDDYFRQMWNRIDPIYQVQTARILLILLQVEESHLYNFPLLGQRYFEFEMDNDDYAVVEETKDWDSPEILQNYEETFLNLEETAKTRINDRCRDLVRIRKNVVGVRPNSWRSAVCPIYRFHIGFLHRTVRDFLRETFFSNLTISARIFSPVNSLCKVFLYLVKSHPILLLQDSGATEFNTREGNAIILLEDGEISGSGAFNNLNTQIFHPIFQEFWDLVRNSKTIIDDTVIDEFIQVTAARTSGSWIEFIGRDIPSPYRTPFMAKDLSIISFAIAMGSPEYVRHIWKVNTVQQFESLGLSPLEIHIMLHTRDMAPVRRHAGKDWYMNPSMVTALLDLRCDPNYKPARLQHSVGIEILATILEMSALVRRNGGFRSKEDAYQAVKILFRRNLVIPTQIDTLWSARGTYRHDTLTRDVMQERLSLVFGVTRARELMEYTKPQLHY